MKEGGTPAKDDPDAAVLAKFPQAAAILRRHGCLMCHSLDGSDGLGPTLKGIYGRPARLANGKLRTRDDAYFRQKILRSDSLELEGDRNVMPNYRGAIPDRDLDTLIAFLKKLQ